jgi:hypothetical protein
MELTMYQCVDSEEAERGPIFDDYDEAVEYARQGGYAVVAYNFEYTDQELIHQADFRPREGDATNDAR